MTDSSFLPTLSQFDVERASQLIQQAYGPPAGSTSPDTLRSLQTELFEIQKKPEAWGLVIPLLNHEDQSVQFFGAHTAQVKIARDWDAFPQDHAESLRDLLISLTAHSTAIGRSKFILRKQFVALVPVHPTRWPDWIMSCVSAFSRAGSPPENIHDFLEIVAEEVWAADLVGGQKSQMHQTLLDSIPLVLQAINATLTARPESLPPKEIASSLKCLQAWIPLLRANDVTSLIQPLISLLTPTPAYTPASPTFSTAFISASDSLQEIMSKSTLADGSGSKTLTEPLLDWLDTYGSQIIATCSIPMEKVSARSSTAYASSSLHWGITPPLDACFYWLPGYYGVDEEESEMTLGFWYLFQEALRERRTMGTYFEKSAEHDEQMLIAKAVYSELVKVLRRKITFPPPGTNWAKDQVEKFQTYRRDVGDTLINAYYVLRDAMLVFYIRDLEEHLARRQEHEGWQEIEASLHCIMCIQESLDLDNTPLLARVFSPNILGRLPNTGHGRIRRTTLSTIGTYATWFSTLPILPPNSSEPNLLLNVLGTLCLQAAVALRNLCDANRKALAPHIAAFGELHAGLESIPDSEKSKVLQSIASVIQALPPDQAIPPVEGIVNPIVQKIGTALQSSTSLPDEARQMAVLQLEILSGVAKGLTRTTDEPGMYDETDPKVQAEVQKVQAPRDDLRMVKLREDIFGAIRTVVDLWSRDADVCHALSDLFKSITSLPSDITLISLPAGPLLELVCLAAQRQLTAVWLSLATILIAQLNPPPFSLTLKAGPSAEAEAVVANTLPVLLQCALGALGVPGAMEANPDIVQEFFGCMERVAQDFTHAFGNLPPGALDALVQCAITALTLQERYSLVSACTFLGTLINRSSVKEELAPLKRMLLSVHGKTLMRSILQGFAAVAPRSVVPNLIELLGTLMTRGASTEYNGGAAHWMREILFSVSGPDAKERFVKSVIGSRNLRRTRDAANQFTLVARGLEGSSFGYASVSM
ncbi:armadillo-type protein [Cyathus striatus]|nr:armadillo-type protein [Cyathus striatus]